MDTKVNLSRIILIWTINLIPTKQNANKNFSPYYIYLIKRFLRLKTLHEINMIKCNIVSFKIIFLFIALILDKLNLNINININLNLNLFFLLLLALTDALA